MRVVSVVSFHVAMSMAESVFVKVLSCRVCMYMCVPPRTPHTTLDSVLISRALNSKALYAPDYLNSSLSAPDLVKPELRTGV